MELNDFFVRLDATLRREGMSYGPGVWLRVHQLINRLNYHRSPPEDFHRLMLQLRPLFCRNPEEQRRFTFVFKQCLIETPHSLASVNQVASPGQRAIDQSLEKAKKINRYWLWGGAVLLLAVVAVIALSWPKPQKIQEPSKPPIIQPDSVKTGETPTKTDLPPEPVKSEHIVNFVAPQPQPDSPESLPWFLLLLYGLPWLVAAWWLGKTYTQKLALAREPGSGDSLLNQLPFEQPFTPIWGGVDAEQSLRELRAARLIATRRLDVKATVEATARSGDYFQPVYRTRRIAPEHVLLVRSVHPHDQQAELAQELAARFKSLGLQVKIYRFRDDPRWLAHSDGKNDQGACAYFHLDQIVAKHGNARLLVISETDILFHPYSGEQRAWLAAFSPWQDKAWLHPQDAHKPHAELLTGRDFLVLPLSRDSLPELVSHLTAVQPSKLTVPEARIIELPDIIRQEPDGWLDEQPPYGVDLDDLEWELEHYLGTYGLRLLRAIAVYPKPHWKLTLALDYLLFGKLGKIDPPARREQRLTRLSRLPWLKHGFMPNWLREHLLVNSDADERQHVVNVWQSLFGQLSQEGGAQTLQLDFNTPSKRQIKLHWNQLRMMPQSNAVNDPIFAHILMGGRFGWLDFHLPHKLARRLPFAQRAMDLRPVFGALAGALLGMAMIFGVIKMTAEPPLDPAQWQVVIQYQPEAKALADLLQHRLLEDRFRVMQTDQIQPGEISDTALKTNTIIFPAGGEKAAERVKQRLTWLAYGADVALLKSPELDTHTIQVYWANTYGAAFNDTLHIAEETRLPFEPEMVRIPSGTFLMGSNDDFIRTTGS